MRAARDPGSDPKASGRGSDLHFSLGGGDICLFDQAEIDRAGNLAPYVVNPRTHIAPPIRRIGHVTIPRLDFQFCQFAGGDVIWSIRSSLLYPIVLLLLVAVLLGRRLKRPRRETEAEGPGTATP